MGDKEIIRQALIDAEEKQGQSAMVMHVRLKGLDPSQLTPRHAKLVAMVVNEDDRETLEISRAIFVGLQFTPVDDLLAGSSLDEEIAAYWEEAVQVDVDDIRVDDSVSNADYLIRMIERLGLEAGGSSTDQQFARKED